MDRTAETQVDSYFKEKVDMLYVGGICNDKEQLNLIKRVSTVSDKR